MNTLEERRTRTHTALCSRHNLATRQKFEFAMRHRISGQKTTVCLRDLRSLRWICTHALSFSWHVRVSCASCSRLARVLLASCSRLARVLPRGCRMNHENFIYNLVDKILHWDRLWWVMRWWDDEMPCNRYWWLQYTCSTLRPAKHSSFRDRCGMFYDETTLWKNARMGIWGMLNCNFWVGFVSNGCLGRARQLKLGLVFS